VSDLLDPDQLLTTFGALGIFLILFAETGLLVGFFLPGDTLLFAAGLLAATPVAAAAHLDLRAVLVAAAAGALLGAQAGYLIGRLVGPRLFSGPEASRRASGMRRSRELLERYGYGRAIVLARFIPLARTLMNPLAGAVAVPVHTFTVWQAIGGLVWTVGLVLIGYLLGRTIPNIEDYLLPAAVVIVVVTLVPVALRSARSRGRITT